MKQFSHLSRIASVSLPRFGALTLAASLGTTALFGMLSSCQAQADTLPDHWVQKEGLAFKVADNNQTLIGVIFGSVNECSGAFMLGEELKKGTSIANYEIDILIQIDGGVPWDAHMTAMPNDAGFYVVVSQALSWEFVKALGTGGKIRIQSKNNPGVVITATLKGSSTTMRKAYNWCEENSTKINTRPILNM